MAETSREAANRQVSVAEGLTCGTRRLRIVARGAVLVGAALLLLSPLPWPVAAQVVPALSPFVGIATSLATRSLGIAALLWAPVAVLAIFRRRWFCRWVCPVGLLTECASSISPISPSRCKPIPPVGIWLALLSISAAAVGYPLMLWLDPMAILSGALGLVFDPAAAAAQTAVGLLAAILVLSFALPGAWCLKMCPLGAAQNLLADPRAWLLRRNKAHSAAAHADLLGPSMNRRNLLATASGATCALAGAPLGLAARTRGHHGAAARLRPPGAAPPWQFGQLCLRCGNCLRACPTKIIVTRWKVDTWSTWLAPMLSFDHDYCRQDCSACMQACPSGALHAKLSAPKPPIGLAEVLMDRCLLAIGRECRTMCLDSCPYDAITIKPWSWEDDRSYPIVASENCPGCGACQLACTPMDAIVVRPNADG